MRRSGTAALKVGRLRLVAKPCSGASRARVILHGSLEAGRGARRRDQRGDEADPTRRDSRLATFSADIMPPGLPDDKRRTQRPEIADDVRDIAAGRLKVADGSGMLRTEDL